MILQRFNRNSGVRSQAYIVTVSYTDPETGETPLSKYSSRMLSILPEDTVLSVLASFVKSNYKLTVEKITTGVGDYGCLESVCKDLAKLTFVRMETKEVPRTIYVKQTVVTDL